MYNKILVPVDGSKSSQKTIAHAAEIASKLGAEVTLLHVIPPLPSAIQGRGYASSIVEEIQKHGSELLEQTKQEFMEFNSGVAVNTEMVYGDPAAEILQKAKNGGYDIIIIGSRGLNELAGFIMGSVSKRVVRHAPCPVLVVR